MFLMLVSHPATHGSIAANRTYAIFLVLPQILCKPHYLNTKKIITLKFPVIIIRVFTPARPNFLWLCDHINFLNNCSDCMKNCKMFNTQVYIAHNANLHMWNNIFSTITSTKLTGYYWTWCGYGGYMAGVAGGGIIWARVDLAHEKNYRTGTGDAQVGRWSCSKVRQTV